MNNADNRILSERAAKQVLARAIELDDLRVAGHSIAELRVVAAEAGVSNEAFERALREIDPTEQPADSPMRNVAVVAAVAGVVIGSATGIADGATHLVSSPFAAGALLMVSGGIAATGNVRSTVRALLRYGVGASVVWGAYAGAWFVGSAAVGGADAISTFVMVRTALLGCGVAGIGGGALAMWRAARARPGATPSGNALDLPLKRRVAQRLKAWIDTWAERVQATPA